MRFFIFACACCLIIASVGCMTKNWSAPIFKDGFLSRSTNEDSVETERKANFWNSKFGESSGIDPRSREIERRLGL